MHACPAPCSDCPFRKNSLPGWLASYSPEELHSIVMAQEIPFPCHMVQESHEWEDAGDENNPLCAGALLMMKKSGKLPRAHYHRVAAQNQDQRHADEVLHAGDFIKHHKQLEK